jgi:hypothetical protein
MECTALGDAHRIGSVGQERQVVQVGYEPRREPAARRLRDPGKIRGQQGIDATVTAIAFDVGTAARNQADEEVALLGRYVEGTARIAVTGVAELIGSTR